MGLISTVSYACRIAMPPVTRRVPYLLRSASGGSHAYWCLQSDVDWCLQSDAEPGSPLHSHTHLPTHPLTHPPTLPLTHPLVIQCCTHFTENRACSLRPGKRSSGRQSRQASRCGADCWPSRSQLQLWVAVHRSFAGSFRLNPAVLRVQSVYFIKKPQRVSIRKEYSSECVRGGMRG